MKQLFLFVFVLTASACASGPTLNKAGLEKYPQCFSHNIKIANKCVDKNDAGEKTTAVQLENTAYPGQYD